MLILASQGIPVEAVGQSVAPDRSLALLIVNAYDHPELHPHRDRAIRSAAAQMIRAGLQPQAVDLRRLSHPAELEEVLASAAIAWALGGATYWLRAAMRVSGFDRLIEAAVGGGTIYGGSSAGAIVAGPSLRGIEPMDSPDGVSPLVDAGLGLCSLSVLPHANRRSQAPALQAIARRWAADGRQVVPIRDGQWVEVDSASVATLCGAGARGDAQRVGPSDADAVRSSPGR